MNTDTRLDLLRRLDGTETLPELARFLGFTPTHPRNRGNGRNPPEPPETPTTCGRRDGAELILLRATAGTDRQHVRSQVRRIHDDDLARHALVIIPSPDWRHITFATTGTDGTVRSLTIDRDNLRPADADALAELAATEQDGRTALAIRHTRALDRGRVGTRFFNDFRTARGIVAAAWTGLPANARDARDQLALLLLSRLLFLYFLQRHGHLCGNTDFLPGLLRHWLHSPGRRTFYRAILRPLFFGALNRPENQRDRAARALGPLPYLNGGLFERHTLERRYGRLDLPDDATTHVIDNLLERHRFTTTEAAPGSTEHDAADAIDPEMLGRVFEGMMRPEHRNQTGTFFTPRTTVDQLVREAITTWLDSPRNTARPREALRSIRILDPACGSGAFLLGSLANIASLRACLEQRPESEIRRELVASAIHGVDIQPDAALLCALRLWLALADTHTNLRPLPNLDRRIRQGDALLDPIDLLLPHTTPPDATRPNPRTLQPLARQYLDAQPRDKIRLRRKIADAERDLARAWIDRLRDRTRYLARELQCLADERDLFGETPESARRARASLAATQRRLDEIRALRRRIRDDRALPFFSFHVHFADSIAAGFDLILSNPPWIRAHRWPRTLHELARQRYEICREPGWKAGTRLGGAPTAAAAQVDVALLFLERAIALLADDGVIAMVLPARAIRSLYAGPARRRLHAELQLASITDFSLDHRGLFDADAFAATIVARKAVSPARNRTTRVTLHHRSSPTLRFHLPATELPLFPDDADAPWLLAPPRTIRALRHMQNAGPPLGTHPGLRIRRGIFTGANDVLLVPEATPRLSGLATIRALGASRYPGRPDADRHNGPHTSAADFEAIIESATLRPIVRGSGLHAWNYQTDGFVIFTHAADGSPTPAPRYLQRYLARHTERLRQRSGIRTADPIGSLLRVTADTSATKLAWRDLAPSLQAAVLPASCRSSLGDVGPVIPLNTLYFLPFDETDTALLLAAFLNSTPYRTFARTIAERAKDTRFRFFAWTIGALPLARSWRSGRFANRLLRIARDAHNDNGIDTPDQQRIDDLVAQSLNLRPDHLDAILEFHHWLDGNNDKQPHNNPTASP